MNKILLATTISAAALMTAGCMTTDSDMSSDDGMSTSANSTTTTGTRSAMKTAPMVSKVGGADMFSNRNIIENAVNSPIHTTLVAAVKQAGLVETLSGPGPFTVFAPTDEAFTAVPAATLTALMQPAAKAQLAGILTYHVVPGRVTGADIMAKIKANNGTATYPTASGGTLTFTMGPNGNIEIIGNNGSKAYITQADVMQSNGVIHVVNGVLLP